jgi:hypothetical protein
MTVDCGLKKVTQVSYAIYILTVGGKRPLDSSSDSDSSSSSEEEAPASQPAPKAKKKGRGKASPKKQPKTAASIVKASEQAGNKERSNGGWG